MSMPKRMPSLLPALFLLLILSACGPGEAPPGGSASPSPASAPESSAAPSLSSPAPDASGGIDPAAAAAVEEAVRLYRAGTTPENATPLPEGFLFPEVLDWDSIPAEKRGESGGLQISVPSASMDSPGGTVTINGQEYAEFCWDGSALETVWFRLNRSETVTPGRE